MIAERQGRSVAEMLRSTSSAEVSEWLALFEVEAQEAERSGRPAAEAEKPRPTIGDKQGIGDAITTARQKQGLAE